MYEFVTKWLNYCCPLSPGCYNVIHSFFILDNLHLLAPLILMLTLRLHYVQETVMTQTSKVTKMF